jgi:di/tricarboxylate transporter
LPHKLAPGVIPISPEIITVISLLVLALALFVLEPVPVDVTALLILVVIGLLDGLEVVDLLPDGRLFSGFSSNAVIAIIGATIVAQALERAGLVRLTAQFIAGFCERNRGNSIAYIGGAAGLLSGFMQNISAAALFLPVTKKVAYRLRISAHSLVMPMGFCTIIGGTLTLVGSSPMLLLNDLLPPGAMQFGLFSVTPVGLSLLAAGLLLFTIFGKYLLPVPENDAGTQDKTELLHKLYRLEADCYIVPVESANPVRGLTVEALERTYGIHIIAIDDGEVHFSPHRDISLAQCKAMAVVADKEAIEAFLQATGLQVSSVPSLKEALEPDNAGLCEVVVRTGAEVIGKTIGAVRIRKHYGITPLAICRGDTLISANFREVELRAGDIILCHMSWSQVAQLDGGSNFAVLDHDYPRPAVVEGKLVVALVIFIIALATVVVTPLKISLVFVAAALAMILARVLSVQQAYASVSWKTVFLLACLLPLGEAMQYTGTADWLSREALGLLGNMPSELALQLGVALLATAFSLVMSNVGATVVLVPLVAEVAANAGYSPAQFALLAVICVANSFVIPTHQVNALMMESGIYKNRDYMRAGGVLTVLYIVVAIAATNTFI